MRYHQLLNESFPLAKQEWEKEANPADVDKYITKFKQLVAKNIVKNQDRDINIWRKHGWEAFKAYVDDRSEFKTRREYKKPINSGDAIEVLKHGEWTVWLPLDIYSNVRLTDGKVWCTGNFNSGEFDYVFKEGFILYVLSPTNPGGWAVVYSDRIKAFCYYDSSDNASDEPDDFIEDTGIKPAMLKKALKPHAKAIEAARDEHFSTGIVSQMNALGYIDSDKLMPRNDKLENLILSKRDRPYALMYAKAVGSENWPEGKALVLDALKHEYRAAKDYVEFRLAVIPADERRAFVDLLLKRGNEHEIDSYLYDCVRHSKVEVDPRLEQFMPTFYKHNPHLAQMVK
jgi:hypothetical protein